MARKGGRNYTQEDLARAVAAVLEGELIQAEAARMFNIPPSTLSKKVNEAYAQQKDWQRKKAIAKKANREVVEMKEDLKNRGVLASTRGSATSDLDFMMAGKKVTSNMNWIALGRDAKTSTGRIRPYTKCDAICILVI